MSDTGKATVIIFGVSGALTHARVRELKSELEKNNLAVALASDATQLQQALRQSKSKVEWAVWAGLSQPLPPTLKSWMDALGPTASTLKFGVLVQTEINATHKRELKNPLVVRNQDALNDLVQAVVQAPVAAAPEPNRNPTVSSTKLASDPLEDLILSMEDHSANAHQKAELPLAAPVEQGVSVKFQLQPLADDIGMASQLGFEEPQIVEPQVVEPAANISKITGRQIPLAPKANLADDQPLVSAVNDESALHEMLKQDEGAFGGPQDISDNTAATVFGVLSDEGADDEQATQLGVSPLAQLTEENSRAPVAADADAPMDLSDIAFTPVGGTLTEVDTLKRYAALKEREAREREATVDVLQKQMSQVKEKMLKSENERRRLAMELDELRVKLKSSEDVRDQHSHQTSRSEAAHNESIKSLQLRLDSAQFQAHKAEKKLEEFRERVRTDILKIRLKERELANKLELQKRDAEALLSAKDERLLAQKRDIDRLEFEIETLKERMIDDTRRAEERAAKLTRALKSLRMAQGMLSGMDEEVLPGTGNNDSDGEAA